MYAVTSSFTSLAAGKSAAWSRRLLIGTSDYSSRVLKWPSISRSWDSAVPASLTIDLSNADRTFNFFMADGTKLHASCSIDLGFAVSSEYVNMLTGTVDSVKFSGEKCTITLVDKFKQLTTRLVGNTTSPVGYTSSNYLVHDLAWYACTSHGGLSSVRSSSNVDIDYDAFGSWTAVFSTDNVRMRAQFTGQQPAEILKRIATMTQSAIWVENNRIKFARFSIAETSSATFDDAITLDASQTMDERSLVNKFYVGAAYSVSSRSYEITVNDISSESVAAYGLVERSVNESAIWYVDSASALNFAQRTVRTGKDIKPQLQFTTPLKYVFVTIGDTITVTDSHLQISDTYRVMKESTDMDAGKKSYTVDQTQFIKGFTLDVSALDSSDVLT